MELRRLASFANSEAMAAGRREKGHVPLCSPGGGGDKKTKQGACWQTWVVKLEWGF